MYNFYRKQLMFHLSHDHYSACVAVILNASNSRSVSPGEFANLCDMFKAGVWHLTASKIESPDDIGHNTAKGV